MRIRDNFHDDRLPETYYSHTCNDLKAFRRLEGNIKVEVVIVGGGLTGVAAAIELSEKGYSVALVEQNLIGWGASGRSAGIITGGFGPGIADFEMYEKIFGRLHAPAMWAMGNGSAGLLKSRVEKYKIECDLTSGHVIGAENDKQLSELKAKHASLKKLSYPSAISIIDGEKTLPSMGASKFIGGLLNTGWGHCHVLNLTRAEARVAATLGARIYEDARVEKITYGDQVIVDTGHCKVTADIAILACNAYMGGLVPELEKNLLVADRYAACTEPLPLKLLQKLNPNNYAFSTHGKNPVHYRSTADNRLLFDGLVNYSSSHLNAPEQIIQNKMLALLPELKQVSLEYIWGGKIAVGNSSVPQVGKIARNVFYAQAYSGQGIEQTHLVARTIANAIDGDDHDFSILSGVRHKPFVGGAFLKRRLFNLGRIFA